MSVKSMEDLFIATLKDIYYAEKQILKALPGMISKADNTDLKKALEAHLGETEGQVERIEKVETAIEPRFQEHFVAAMAIPHKTAAYPNLAAAVTLPAPKEATGGGGEPRRRRRAS